jgi:fibronectin type 3 domain-containing protein
VLAFGWAPSANATNWAAGLNTASAAQATADTLPSAPSGVSATCTSPTQTTIVVTWSAVTHATSYTIYQSTTSQNAGYAVVATAATTTWTTAALANNKYFYEITTNIGTNWTSARSGSTTKRTISSGTCA